MTTIKTIEKNFENPDSRDYVKLVQTFDKEAEDNRKYAVEVYLHTSNNLVAHIHSSMLYKSDMVFDALVRNYI